MKPILITSYVNPDLDGVAGIIGYAEFLAKTGKNVTTGILGQPLDEAKYVLGRFNIPYPPAIQNTDAYDEVILLDASCLNDLEGKIAPDKVIEIIDHRKVNDADKFPNAKTQIEQIGASATLVAEKFKQNDVVISRESAILILSAIISNTFNFKAALTSDRDREMTTWLNQIAQLPETFWRELFLAKSEMPGPKLTERIESDFMWFNAGRKKVGIAQIEIIGAKQLVEERYLEIIQTIENLRNKLNLDFVFQNTVELEEAKNYFVAADEATKQLLEKVLDVKFSDPIAERPNLIMRKQIVPLLKEELEKYG